jgi:hypothetical protein
MLVPLVVGLSYAFRDLHAARSLRAARSSAWTISANSPPMTSSATRCATP